MFNFFESPKLIFMLSLLNFWFFPKFFCGIISIFSKISDNLDNSNSIKVFSEFPVG